MAKVHPRFTRNKKWFGRTIAVAISTSLQPNAVIYQVLSRADGIFVDIHMEASQSTFHPLNAKHKVMFVPVAVTLNGDDVGVAWLANMTEK